jgi:cell division protein FtsB
MRTEQPNEPDVRDLMIQVVEAIRESNIETGRLLSVTNSAVSRMNVLVVLVTVVIGGLGVQLFLGFTSQELVRSAKVQLVLEAQARAALETQFKEAVRTVTELKGEVKELRASLQEIPKVTVASSGQVNLEVHADEDAQNKLRDRGAPASETVSIPLQFKKKPR